MRPGDVIDGRFELLRLAGEGGMGAVFEAREVSAPGRVALKLMRGDGAEPERFLREAETLAALRHPHVVRHVAHGVCADGALYLAMEWLEGEDLYARIWRQRLSTEEAIDIARRAADALSAAHERGVVHRDVKPSNLFLEHGDTARLKLLDFGIARIKASPRPLTATGTTIGTPGYMAPEQARGERDVDARADVFSLGCVLFECLTGRPPFVGQHVMAVLAKVLLEEAPRVWELAPDTPRALDELVARMLAKRPEERPPSSAAVASALAAIAADPRLSFPLPRPSAPPPASLSAGEQRVVCVLLARGLRSPPGQGELETGRIPPGPTSLADAPTLLRGGAGTIRLDAASNAEVDLRTFAEQHGGRLERLADGSALVAFSGPSAPTDLAARAARCARRLWGSCAHAAVGLATGRAALTGSVAVGEALDRAAALASLPRSASGPQIDAATAGLVEARFVVLRGAELVLGDERVGAALPRRLLLGRPTPFVGRDAELVQLLASIDACVGEPAARVVALTGPPGMGKSRLREELLGRVASRWPRATTWISSGDPVGAGSPFGVAGALLRRAAGVAEGAPAEVRSGKLQARLARHLDARDLPRVSSFLGQLVHASASGEGPAMIRAAREDARIMHDQIHLAWVDWLDAETRDHPVLLVLEDLHWGDRPSVDLIDAALRRLEDRPLFVLALARPEIGELFPGLWAARGVQTIALGELRRRAGEAFVRAVLGDHVDPGIVGRIVEHAAGNAFHLEELVRWAAEGGGERPPDTVLGMIEARVGRLDPEARRLLRAASIFGQVFWRGAVRALLGSGELDALLDELVRQELVSPAAETAFEGETEYVFRHALVREAAYAMLTEEDRRLGHGLAGTWLEAAGETDALALAEHFERGGELERAALAYRRAAEQALEGRDPAAVIERVGRAVRCGAEGELLGALRLLEAESRSWRAEHREAGASARAAMALLPPRSPGWYRAAQEAATASGTLASLETLEALCDELLGAGALEDGTGPALVACVRIAMQSLYVGRRDVAEDLLERVERRARDSQDAELRPLLLRVRAWRAYMAADFGTYCALLAESIEALEAVGDLRDSCGQRVNMGHALLEIGAYERAEICMREALSIAHKLDLRRSRAVASVNLGFALSAQGRLDEAIVLLGEEAEALAASGDVRQESGARIYLATSLSRKGEIARAEREARRAVELTAHMPAYRAHAAAVLAHVLLTRGVADEALAVAAEAMDTVRSLGRIEEGEPLVRLAHAEALRASGRTAEARAAIVEARALVLDRARRIDDPEIRRSFLESVAENARTLELAALWSAGG